MIGAWGRTELKMAGAVQAHIDRKQDHDDPAALLRTLDSLRTVITIFDSGGRLLYANAHLNYLFRSFPPRDTLIGKTYEELIRLEIEGGEIAPARLAGGAKPSSPSVCGSCATTNSPRATWRCATIGWWRSRPAATPDGQTVLVWTDVTVPRARSVRLQEAVALSAEAFAFYDADDRLILANELYAHLCGVKDVGRADRQDLSRNLRQRRL
jgi:PAS domain-containing protein